MRERVVEHLRRRRDHEHAASAHERLAHADARVKRTPSHRHPRKHGSIKRCHKGESQRAGCPWTWQHNERCDDKDAGKASDERASLPLRRLPARSGHCRDEERAGRHADVLPDLEGTVHAVACHALRRVTPAHRKGQPERSGRDAFPVEGRELRKTPSEAALPCGYVACKPLVFCHSVHTAKMRPNVSPDVGLRADTDWLQRT